MKKNSHNNFVSIEKLFKLIRNTSIIYFFTLTLISYFFPAPIGHPSNSNIISKTPKAAWFLVWIQELISYSIDFVYILLFFMILFFLLPYISFAKDVECAMWFPKHTRCIQFGVGVIVFIIVILWIVGMFFRGENWQIRF